MNYYNKDEMTKVFLLIGAFLMMDHQMQAQDFETAAEAVKGVKGTWVPDGN